MLNNKLNYFPRLPQIDVASAPPAQNHQRNLACKSVTKRENENTKENACIQLLVLTVTLNHSFHKGFESNFEFCHGPVVQWLGQCCLKHN